MLRQYGCYGCYGYTNINGVLATLDLTTELLNRGRGEGETHDAIVLVIQDVAELRVQPQQVAYLTAHE